MLPPTWLEPFEAKSTGQVRPRGAQCSWTASVTAPASTRTVLPTTSISGRSRASATIDSTSSPSFATAPPARPVRPARGHDRGAPTPSPTAATSASRRRFNARARAANFDEARARANFDTVARHLHEHGVRAYVTLNTLVFDASSPPSSAPSARAPRPASTRSSCKTSASPASCAPSPRAARAREHPDDLHRRGRPSSSPRELGAARHPRARALARRHRGHPRTDDRRRARGLRARRALRRVLGPVPHQRGHRRPQREPRRLRAGVPLPYELVVDGELRDTGDRAYLLSPEDLEASALVPALAALGVVVAEDRGDASRAPPTSPRPTRLYRAAVDGRSSAPRGVPRPSATTRCRCTRAARARAFSRASTTSGSSRARLRPPRPRAGLSATGCARSSGRAWLRVALDRAARARRRACWSRAAAAATASSAGACGPCLASRAATSRRRAGARGARVARAPTRTCERRAAGRPRLEDGRPRATACSAAAEREPHRVRVDVTRARARSASPGFEARSEAGARARSRATRVLEPARTLRRSDRAARQARPPRRHPVRARRRSTIELPEGAMLPPSRSTARAARSPTRSRAAAVARARDHGRPSPICSRVARRPTRARARRALRAVPHAGAGARGARRRRRRRVPRLPRAHGHRAPPCARCAPRGRAFVGLAPPRIRKPGEEKIDRYLARLGPDALLVRSLGALCASGQRPRRAARRRLLAQRHQPPHRGRGARARARAFTPRVRPRRRAGRPRSAPPSARGPSSWCTTRCRSSTWSTACSPRCSRRASDHRDCGRPCEQHALSLRDRAGMEHPVEADVGCRNTVFHAAAQSARASWSRRAARGGAALSRRARARGGRRRRAHRRGVPPRLLALRTEGGYGVVRGSLRLLAPR
jgi:putative protease